jgi:hypothetical protein
MGNLLEKALQTSSFPTDIEASDTKKGGLLIKLYGQSAAGSTKALDEVFRIYYFKKLIFNGLFFKYCVFRFALFSQSRRIRRPEVVGADITLFQCVAEGTP